MLPEPAEPLWVPLPLQTCGVTKQRGQPRGCPSAGSLCTGSWGGQHGGNAGTRAAAPSPGPLSVPTAQGRRQALPGQETSASLLLLGWHFDREQRREQAGQAVLPPARGMNEFINPSPWEMDSSPRENKHREAEGWQREGQSPCLSLRGGLRLRAAGVGIKGAGAGCARVLDEPAAEKTRLAGQNVLSGIQGKKGESMTFGKGAGNSAQQGCREVMQGEKLEAPKPS